MMSMTGERGCCRLLFAEGKKIVEANTILYEVDSHHNQGAGNLRSDRE